LGTQTLDVFVFVLLNKPKMTPVFSATWSFRNYSDVVLSKKHL